MIPCTSRSASKAAACSCSESICPCCRFSRSRAATDKAVTRRYDITNDDRLRNLVNVERITPDSYISIAGWAFEGLRVDDKQRQIPFALPVIDTRFRMDDVLSGKLELQANSLS